MKIKASPFFLVYFAFLCVFSGVYSVTVYVLTLILHEYAHAIEAQRRGYKLGRINLSIFGASISGEYDGMKSEDELSVAVAGPIMNLVVCLICSASWWMFPSTYYFTMEIAYANLGMFLFNLLPIYPLDGGRICIAFLSKKVDRKTAFKKLRVLAIILAIIFVLAFVYLLVSRQPLNSITALIFILISTFFPDKTCKYHRLYQLSYRAQKLNKGLQLKEIALNDSVSVETAEKMLNARYYTCFVLLDKSLTPYARLYETAFENSSARESETVKQLYEKTKKERKGRISV